MKLVVALTSLAITLVENGANSADVAMRRVLSCNGSDAKIELYIPQAAWTGACGVS